MELGQTGIQKRRGSFWLRSQERKWKPKPLGVEDQAKGLGRWKVGEVGEEHPRKY